MALQCGVNLKSATSNHHPSRSMDNQQIKEIEIIKKEMDRDRDVNSVPKVSRRRVAIGLVGFSSVILHVCPAHGRTLPLMGDVKFKYNGSAGPDKWGSMSPSYGSCSFGNAQSPVQIMENDIVLDGNMGPFIVGYNDVSATLVNNGFNCELRYENDDVGGAIIDGKNYTLKQMHWHSPSEHKIEGVRYAAELHMVHISVDGSISVVAILYKYGVLDPLLSQIKEEFDELAKQASAGHARARIPIKLMGIKDIIMPSNSKEYFRYVGSLTTPPCTEKVIWNVFKEVREISLDQVAALKAPLDESCKNNSKPIQPLNGRHVELSAAAASLT